MKVTVLKNKIICNGRFLSKGESFDLDDDKALKYAKKGFVEISDEETNEVFEQLDEQSNEEFDVESLTVAELKNLITGFGVEIPSGSLKADLVQMVKDIYDTEE